jgi:hypothetical protein
MKLFVRNPGTRQKNYLNISASSRNELANLIGNAWFNFNGNQYHVHQVIAEPDNNNTAAGALIGGVIGLLGGPFGILIGGALGGALGNEGDKTEAEKVNHFNHSRVS